MSQEESWEPVGSSKTKKKKKRPPPTKRRAPPLPPPQVDNSTQSRIKQDGKPFQHPHFLMLMGLPGSGKSTLALKLEKLPLLRYRRINQDELKDRKACIKAAESAWRKGESPILDRCNASIDQRKHFLILASRLAAPVHLVILDVDRTVCLERARARSDHPTVTPAMAAKVIGFMQADWKMPVPEEGFQSVTILKTDQDRQAFLQQLLQPPDPGTNAEAEEDDQGVEGLTKAIAKAEIDTDTSIHS